MEPRLCRGNRAGEAVTSPDRLEALDWRRLFVTVLGGLIGYGIALHWNLPLWSDWNLMGDCFDWVIVCALLARQALTHPKNNQPTKGQSDEN